MEDTYNSETAHSKILEALGTMKVTVLEPGFETLPAWP